jgi:hypothetical protein
VKLWASNSEESPSSPLLPPRGGQVSIEMPGLEPEPETVSEFHSTSVQRRLEYRYVLSTLTFSTLTLWYPPQNVQLHNVRLQNVQLQNVHLPNIQLQNVRVTKCTFFVLQVTKCPIYNSSRLPDVQLLYKTSRYVRFIEA